MKFQNLIMTLLLLFLNLKYKNNSKTSEDSVLYKGFASTQPVK